MVHFVAAVTEVVEIGVELAEWEAAVQKLIGDYQMQ